MNGAWVACHYSDTSHVFPAGVNEAGTYAVHPHTHALCSCWEEKKKAFTLAPTMNGSTFSFIHSEDFVKGCTETSAVTFKVVKDILL